MKEDYCSAFCCSGVLIFVFSELIISLHLAWKRNQPSLQNENYYCTTVKTRMYIEKILYIVQPFTFVFPDKGTLANELLQQSPFLSAAHDILLQYITKQDEIRSAV